MVSGNPSIPNKQTLIKTRSTKNKSIKNQPTKRKRNALEGRKRNALDGSRQSYTVTVPGRIALKRRQVEVVSSHLSAAKHDLLKTHLEPFVEIRKSTIPGAGVGVFALQELPKGFQLPYIGKVYKGEFDQIIKAIGRGNDLTYIFHDDSNDLVIDAHPRYNSTRCNVCFRMNEPPKGTKASFEFVSSKGWAKRLTTIVARATRKIKSGEELFVHYGDQYDRSHYS